MDVLKTKIHELFLSIKKQFKPKYWRALATSPNNLLCNFHFGIGIYLRNEILTTDNALYKLFIKKGITNLDDMSAIIIEEFHNLLRKTYHTSYINKRKHSSPYDYNASSHK